MLGVRGEGRLVHVRTGVVTLTGNLVVPEGAAGIVLFAHGSGSSRLSPCNRSVARLAGDWLLERLAPPKRSRKEKEK